MAKVLLKTEIKRESGLRIRAGRWSSGNGRFKIAADTKFSAEPPEKFRHA